MLASRVASATSTLSQRATRGSRPNTSTRMAPRIGSQIRTLRRGHCAMVVVIPRRSGGKSREQPPRSAEQEDEAEDHRERIVIEITRLDSADNGRGAVDQAGGTVDGTVDECGIATAPQSAPEADAGAREYRLVQIVDPVLVRQQGVDGT